MACLIAWRWPEGEVEVPVRAMTEEETGDILRD
jgi:hypothetical protein